MKKIIVIPSSNKKSAFLHTLWIMRWLVSAIIVAAFPPQHPNAIWAYVLIMVAALYSLGQALPRVKRWPVFSTPFSALVVDNIYVITFMYISGGLSSPFEIFLIFSILSCVYWYGLTGAMTVIFFQSTLSIIFLTNPGYHPLLLSPLPATVSLIAGFCALAVLAGRLTRTERNERNSLIALESQMSVERERLMVLINNLPEATFIIDAKGKILLSNASALTLLGATGNLSGRSLTKLFKLSDQQDKPIELMNIANADHSLQRTDIKLHSSDKSLTMLDLHIAPVTINHSAGLNFIVIARDITKAKSLDQQREEFIAVTSHELKTPLAIAEAALSTALRPQMNASPEVSNMMRQAYRNVIFLGEIVKDLTTLAQASNDNIPIKLQPLNAKALIEQLTNEYRLEASRKQIKLSVNAPSQIPDIITTEHYIREILQNYLVNAIKYTPHGTVTISCKATEDRSIVFCVQDSGIGISASDQSHLFTKFWRSEDYRTRETGGTGLGLYLCWELAQRLNAQVWCKSTLNKGSAFYLEVPPVSQLKRDRGEVVKAQVSTLVEEL